MVPGIEWEDEWVLLGDVLSNITFIALSCKTWKNNNNKPKVFDSTIRADTSNYPKNGSRIVPVKKILVSVMQHIGSRLRQYPGWV